MAMLWKILALVAVLLMPFGMTAAPAAPAHPAPVASMPMQHCPEQAPAKNAKGGFVECTMACAAALPAADFAQEAHLLIACAPTAPAAAQMLHGIHPDTATPPPKRS